MSRSCGFVLPEDVPAPRALGPERDALVTTLAEPQEEREQRGADQEPVAHDDVDGERAGHGPEDEARREDEDVEDDLVLEPRGIQDVHHAVARHDEREARPDEDAPGHGGDRQHGRGGERQRHRHLAGGDGPVALLRMLPIRVAIVDVVEQVHGAAHQAEQQERRQRPAERRQREDVVGEEERRQQQQVLDPLPRTQRVHQRPDGSAMGVGAPLPVGGVQRAEVQLGLHRPVRLRSTRKFPSGVATASVRPLRNRSAATRAPG